MKYALPYHISRRSLVSTDVIVAFACPYVKALTADVYKKAIEKFSMKYEIIIISTKWLFFCGFIKSTQIQSLKIKCIHFQYNGYLICILTLMCV